MSHKTISKNDLNINYEPNIKKNLLNRHPLGQLFDLAFTDYSCPTDFLSLRLQ
jgi:hypothetical protein